MRGGAETREKKQRFKRSDSSTGWWERASESEGDDEYKLSHTYGNGHVTDMCVWHQTLCYIFDSRFQCGTASTMCTSGSEHDSSGPFTRSFVCSACTNRCLRQLQANWQLHQNAMRRTWRSGRTKYVARMKNASKSNGTADNAGAILPFSVCCVLLRSEEMRSQVYHSWPHTVCDDWRAKIKSFFHMCKSCAWFPWNCVRFIPAVDAFTRLPTFSSRGGREWFHCNRTFIADDEILLYSLNCYCTSSTAIQINDIPPR